jgi:hypothetical protein
MVRPMKSRPILTCFLALGAAVLATLAGVSTVRADLYVLESTTAAIKPGSRLGTSDTINVPAGAYIRAVLPSGKTQTIRGPYSGSVGDFAKGQAQNEGVLSWLRNILQTGGASEATPGATRSIGREMPRAKAPFSWVEIPVTADGNICVQKGADLKLIRAPGAPDRVAVIDAATSQRGEAQWGSGSTVTAWPTTLSVKSGATYYLVVPDRQRRQITLRVVERLPAEGDELTELHKLGCRAQFEAWVRERMAASKRS